MRLPKLAKGLFALLFVCTASAHAQLQLAQQDLYLDAMRSIADGRKTDASDALTRMIEQEPQHAGAWLDLAIIQCELGRAAEAERLFNVIETRFSPPPAILEVIARQRAEGCAGWQPRRQFSVSLGRGIDSNVNQGASNPIFTIGSGDYRVDLELLPEYLPQHDQYTVLSTEYMRELTPNGVNGYLQFRALHNDTFSRYSTSSLVAGVERPWRIGDWAMRGTALVGLHGLGGKLYQIQSQVQTRVTVPLKLPDNFQTSVIASVSNLNYPSLSSFDANTAELRGVLSYNSERTQGQTSVGYISDRGAANRPGGDRTGWFANLHARRRINDFLTGEFGWSYHRWQGESMYSPGFIDEIRHQKTSVLRGALVFPIADKQAIYIEVRKVKNNENISVFQYNSRQLQVSWQWHNF
ncbi:tetratricopeptide repeat protein [Noviherbaspirillum sp.]|uniref:tetratricopeptide repeat protein n=1 Tax=Noviherbaspirillum sp. TaxID=1926288 RepID=UPI002FE0938A